MQKNRTAVAAGILVALALIVGGFALWNNQKATDAPVTVETPMPGDTSANTDPTGTDVTDEPAATNETTTPVTTEPTPGAGQSAQPNTNTGSTSAVTIPATHTVKANETLREIAQHYYGDPIYSADIERVNNIEDANHIVVGTELKLPRWDELNDTAPTTAPGASGTNEAGTPGAGNNDTPQAENNADENGASE